MRASRAQGFTLLEVLVALIIAMLVVGVFTAGTIEGIRAARDSARVEEATVLARSRLALTAEAPVVGDFQGDEGNDFHWRIHTSVKDSYTGPDTRTVTNLYAITVWVSWRSGARLRDVRLEGEHLFTALPASQTR